MILHSNWSRCVRNSGTLLSVLLASSCSDCFAPSTAAFAPYVPPAVARIELNPSTGLASGSMAIRVDAYDAADDYIWIEDRPDLAIAWTRELAPDPLNALAPTAAPMASFSNASINPTVLTISGPLPRPLVVKAVVSWTGGSLQTTATFLNTLPASADRVEAMSIGTSFVSLLRTCSIETTVVTEELGVVNRFFNGTDLDRNLTESDTGAGIHCGVPTEYALFGRDYRMLFADNASLSGTPIWKPNLGDLLKRDAAADWKPPDEIDVYLHYFVGTSPDPTGDVAMMIKDANIIFADNGLGIRIVAVPPPALHGTKTGGCDDPLVVEELLALDGLSTADPKVHVLFVTDITDTGMDGMGKLCGLPDAGTAGGGRFILMDWGLAGAETLAHEVGHVLGHSSPYINTEHVWYDWEGFSKDNLMHPKWFDIGRDKLTTGQIFRMNVDQNSWYQHDPTILQKHPKKICALAFDVDSPCPRLNRQPGGP